MLRLIGLYFILISYDFTKASDILYHLPQCSSIDTPCLEQQCALRPNERYTPSNGLCNLQCGYISRCIKVPTPGCECKSNYCRNRQQNCISIDAFENLVYSKIGLSNYWRNRFPIHRKSNTGNGRNRFLNIDNLKNTGVINTDYLRYGTKRGYYSHGDLMKFLRNIIEINNKNNHYSINNEDDIIRPVQSMHSLKENTAQKVIPLFIQQGPESPNLINFEEDNSLDLRDQTTDDLKNSEPLKELCVPDFPNDCLNKLSVPDVPNAPISQNDQPEEEQPESSEEDYYESGEEQHGQGKQAVVELEEGQQVINETVLTNSIQLSKVESWGNQLEGNQSISLPDASIEESISESLEKLQSIGNHSEGVKNVSTQIQDNNLGEQNNHTQNESNSFINQPSNLQLEQDQQAINQTEGSQRGDDMNGVDQPGYVGLIDSVQLSKDNQSVSLPGVSIEESISENMEFHQSEDEHKSISIGDQVDEIDSEGVQNVSTKLEGNNLGEQNMHTQNESNSLINQPSNLQLEQDQQVINETEGSQRGDDMNGVDKAGYVGLKDSVQLIKDNQSISIPGASIEESLSENMEFHQSEDEHESISIVDQVDKIVSEGVQNVSKKLEGNNLGEQNIHTQNESNYLINQPSNLQLEQDQQVINETEDGQQGNDINGVNQTGYVWPTNSIQMSQVELDGNQSMSLPEVSTGDSISKIMENIQNDNENKSILFGDQDDEIHSEGVKNVSSQVASNYLVESNIDMQNESYYLINQPSNIQPGPLMNYSSSSYPIDNPNIPSSPLINRPEGHNSIDYPDSSPQAMVDWITRPMPGLEQAKDSHKPNDKQINVNQPSLDGFGILGWYPLLTALPGKKVPNSTLLLSSLQTGGLPLGNFPTNGFSTGGLPNDHASKDNPVNIHLHFPYAIKPFNKPSNTGKPSKDHFNPGFKPYKGQYNTWTSRPGVAIPGNYFSNIGRPILNNPGGLQTGVFGIHIDHIHHLGSGHTHNGKPGANHAGFGSVSSSRKPTGIFQNSLRPVIGPPGLKPTRPILYYPSMGSIAPTGGRPYPYSMKPDYSGGNNFISNGKNNSMSQGSLVDYFKGVYQDLLDWYTRNVNAQEYLQPKHFLNYVQTNLIALFKWRYHKTKDPRWLKYTKLLKKFSF